MKVKILSVGQPIGTTGDVVSSATLDELQRTFPDRGVPVVSPSSAEAPRAIGWATSVSREGDDFVAHVELSAAAAAHLAALGTARLPVDFGCSVALDPVAGSPRRHVFDVCCAAAPSTRRR